MRSLPTLKKHLDTKRWNCRKKEKHQTSSECKWWSCTSKGRNWRISRKQIRNVWKRSMNWIPKVKGKLGFLSKSRENAENSKKDYLWCKTSWMKEKECIIKTEILLQKTAPSNLQFLDSKKKLAISIKRWNNCRQTMTERHNSKSDDHFNQHKITQDHHQASHQTKEMKLQQEELWMLIFQNKVHLNNWMPKNRIKVSV